LGVALARTLKWEVSLAKSSLLATTGLSSASFLIPPVILLNSSAEMQAYLLFKRSSSLTIPALKATL
jgi:hypothetical protein